MATKTLAIEAVKKNGNGKGVNARTSMEPQNDGKGPTEAILLFRPNFGTDSVGRIAWLTNSKALPIHFRDRKEHKALEARAKEAAVHYDLAEESARQIRECCDFELDAVCDRIEGIQTNLQGLWEDVQDHKAEAATIAGICGGMGSALELCVERLRRCADVIREDVGRIEAAKVQAAA